MKRVILILLVSSFHNLLLGQTVVEKLHQYFQAAQKAGIFNGSVTITKGRDVLIDTGYGFKNFETGATNDANTIFQIGSVTKQFTSTIVLRLAERKKLSLSDKLSKYFPEFPNAAKVTVENLLSHTSGIYNYTNDTGFMAHNVESSFNRQALSTMIKDKPLEFEPGTKFSYSNSGYLLLGYIIEKVTGRKYEQLVREQIFTPLNMNHSGFDFTHLENANRATGYSSISGVTPSRSVIVDSSVSFAAGDIYSSVGDLNKWDQSLSTEKVLRKLSLDSAFKIRQSKYGLGWNIDTIYKRRIISHNGGIFGFLSHNSIIPQDNICVTFLSNTETAEIDEISKCVYAILYNEPYILLKEIVPDLKQFVGEYELARTFKITVTLANGVLKGRQQGNLNSNYFQNKEIHLL